MDYIITEEMIKNSLVSKGDISRIAEVLKKAQSGQDIIVAFMINSYAVIDILILIYVILKYVSI